MNETNPVIPPVPPLIPSAAPAAPAPEPPAEESPLPVPHVFAAIEGILRQPRRLVQAFRSSPGAGLGLSLLAVALVGSLVYGLVVGSFSGGMQLWAAPLKIAGGLLVAGLICLPSLYIFSCLGGSQARLGEVVGLLAGLLALMTLLLLGFAPVAWIFSQSTESVAAMGLLHLLFWIIATWFGVRFLWRGFCQLGGGSGGSLGVWVVVFILVMLQMTTALRPLVGSGKQVFTPQKKFFLSHWGDCLDEEEKRGPAPVTAPPKDAASQAQ